MRIAYLHRLGFPETESRFFYEASELGIELVPIRYNELKLVGQEIYWRETAMSEFDGWYFRAVGTELEWAKLLELYAKKKEIKAVDEYLLTQGPLRRFKSVMGWQLLEAGINYPQTSFVGNLDDLARETTNRQFPLVVKLSQGGRHGISTFWIKDHYSLTELKEKLMGRIKKAVAKRKAIPVYEDFLVQDFIENDGDYRVMVVGYKCIGGFKRAVKEEKLVMNKSVGRSVKLERVPDEVIEQAERAARALGVEVAGIDLVKERHTDKIFVIEVNEAPQFKVFEKRTGVNAAREILLYLQSKFAK